MSNRFPDGPKYLPGDGRVYWTAPGGAIVSAPDPFTTHALPDCERIARVCRHFAAIFDEFGPDPSVMGYELECLEAAMEGRPAPRDEGPPR